MKSTLFKYSIFLIIVTAIFSSPQVNAKDITLPDSMYFRSGDDSSWAAADIDLSEWKKVKLWRIPLEEWKGIGWIRIEVEISDAMRGKTLALYLRSNGGVDVYHNGTFLYSSGKVGKSQEDEKAVIARHPIPLQLSAEMDSTNTRHVFAFRYSAHILQNQEFARHQPYLYFLAEEYNSFISRLFPYRKIITVRQTFLSSIFLIFAFIHLLLFLYYRSIRANITFAIFSFFCAVAVYTIYETRVSDTPEYDRLMLLLGDSGLLLLSLSAIAFIHTVFYNKLLKRFYIYAAAVLIGLFLVWTPNPFPRQTEFFVEIATLLSLPEFFVCWIARKINGNPSILDGGWIVGVGSLPMLGLGFHRFLEIMGFDVFSYNFLQTPLPFYGVLLMMLSMSILLARNVAKTSRDLQQQLKNVERLNDEALTREIEKTKLAAENERKTRELDSARELQLSMLPASLPQSPSFELAATMETASEVGGDYYDLRYEDGILTGAVGDATGHGLKAGIVVAATKSLFNSLLPQEELLPFLKNASTALKGMGFSQMYMGLTLFRLDDKGTLTITSAGMPLPIIYRSSKKTLEELSLKGMPLGSFPDFPYTIHTTELNRGDILLLMSDGLPERFNSTGEELGEQKIMETLKEFADQPAKEILHALMELERQWSDSRPKDDDITLLMLKKS